MRSGKFPLGSSGYYEHALSLWLLGTTHHVNLGWAVLTHFFKGFWKKWQSRVTWAAAHSGLDCESDGQVCVCKAAFVENGVQNYPLSPPHPTPGLPSQKGWRLLTDVVAKSQYQPDGSQSVKEHYHYAWKYFWTGYILYLTLANSCVSCNQEFAWDNWDSNCF